MDWDHLTQLEPQFNPDESVRWRDHASFHRGVPEACCRQRASIPSSSLVLNGRVPTAGKDAGSTLSCHDEKMRPWRDHAPRNGGSCVSGATLLLLHEAGSNRRGRIVFAVETLSNRSGHFYRPRLAPVRYAPQDSRTTSRGVSARLRAGRVGSAIRSSMARKAISAISRQGW